MLKRKWWVVLAALVVLSLLFTACGGDDEEEAPAEKRAVTLQVWAEANEVEHWRADGPAKAAADVTDFDLTVEPLNDDAGWADYKKKFTLAADAGEGPDIVLSGHEDVPVWANAGYIVDFEFCRDKYPEFDDVIDSLWDSVTWQGKLWGVPQDTEARPMFYNKTKLKELGWSDADVARKDPKRRLYAGRPDRHGQGSHRQRCCGAGQRLLAPAQQRW
jgi:inositol-phosphate transport system substrate-binding protein